MGVWVALPVVKRLAGVTAGEILVVIFGPLTAFWSLRDAQGLL